MYDCWGVKTVFHKKNWTYKYYIALEKNAWCNEIFQFLHSVISKLTLDLDFLNFCFRGFFFVCTCFSVIIICSWGS